MPTLLPTPMERSPPAIRVAIVEDRQVDRESLKDLLKAAPGFACVDACASATEALDRLPDSRPRIVLMDIQLPGISGIECVRQLSGVLPDTQFMMLTVLEDHDLIFRSLAAGATGYLLKKTPSDQLLGAIRELDAGGAPMSGQVARKVVAAFRHPPAPTSELDKLSPAEQGVLHRLARGLLYKEVADEMGISVSTVRTHVWHIYRKLQVHNRTEAILKVAPGG
ncbi:MAG TPA: response regulator transcription factor [Verrucomicrobiae bacterium]